MNNIGIRPEYLNRALIPKLNGPIIEVRPNAQANTLDRVAKKISEEYRIRKQRAGPRKRNADGTTPDEWLREVLYGVILLWLNDDDRPFIEARVPTKLVASDGLTQNPAKLFHRMIAAILSNELPDKSASWRARLAEPMWYAFRHYIPPELLLGFNHRFPAHRNNYARTLIDLEPTLIGWIKEQRLYARWRDEYLENYRGKYPSEIEHFVGLIVDDYY